MSKTPSDRKYSQSHEWALKEGDEVKIGITEFAQHELGDIVFVELPPAGSKFKQEEAFGVVESVKAASDLYLPIAGEITAVNEDVTADPALVNRDPYGKGWMVKVKPSKASEIDQLLDAKGYTDFVASSIKE